MTPYPDAEAHPIQFFVETGGKELPLNEQDHIRSWLENVIGQKQCELQSLNYIFCGDDYLHKLNVQYLSHDTLTDIITFPMEDPPLIAGDIFISTERVAENAADLSIPYTTELQRVIVHGVLHLCGQGDKSEAEAQEMRNQENWALSLLR